MLISQNESELDPSVMGAQPQHVARLNRTELGT